MVQHCILIADCPCTGTSKLYRLLNSELAQSDNPLLPPSTGSWSLQKYTLLDSSDEFMRATFEVNVFGTVELSRQLLPHMLERHRGQFIVVSA